MTNTIDRFLEKVDKTVDCWIWKGCIGTGGYGLFGFRGKVWKSHRVSFVLFSGEIPNNLWVLHRCDVRNCVNPEHLFIGDRQDNVDDMCRKGRNLFFPGEDHPGAKLTNSQLDEIRSRYVWGIGKELAKEFGVCPQNIYQIVKGRNRRTKW